MEPYRIAVRCCLVGCLLTQQVACSFESPVGNIFSNAYDCDCTCKSEGLTAISTPAASADDAEETLADNAVTLNGNVLDMGVVNGQAQVVGIRFPSLGIPRGATIRAALVQFRVSAPTTEATSLSIFGQAADNAPSFAATTANLSTRARTSAFVTWMPPAWNTANESGPAQGTSDLSAILQEIIDRPGWSPGNAAVVLISGTGLRRAISFDANPTTAPRLLVTYDEPALALSLPVCMPEPLNYYLNGGVTPNPNDVALDCESRVTDTLSGMTLACDYPSTCSCTLRQPLQYAERCRTACAETPLAADCANFDPVGGNVLATNAPGDSPICTTNAPLAAALFGQRSACDVSGSAQIEVDDETKNPDASGLVEFTTSGCPGPSCAASMSYAIAVDPVTYERTFGSATFRDLGALGQTLPGSEALLSAGAGSFDPGAAAFSASGRREGEGPQGLDGTNEDAVDITLDLTPGAASCSVSGALIGAVDPEARRCEDAGQSTANAPCTTDADCALPDDEENPCSDGVCNCLPFASEVDMTLSIDVAGPIVNQPPFANAGADQIVECDLPGAARVTLDGLASGDPDGNFASFRWFRGSRAGDVLGAQPRITLEQALDTQVNYVFRLIDTFGQSDEDTTQVQVADTTPPLVACNAPATTAPPSTPLTFTATASDVCDPQVAAELTGFRCFRIAPNGTEINTTNGCGVTLDGATVRISRSTGVGNHVVWSARALDDSGNVGTTTCELVVVRP